MSQSGRLPDPLRLVLRGLLLLLLALWLTGAGLAQTAEPQALDYAAWEKQATRAEKALTDRDSTNVALEQQRAQLVEWREALLGAQSANSTRIATLRTQIAALGPPPTEGVTEAREIADRRKELNDQLVKLQAPGIAAEEAYSRADGLIREVDRVLRERQADEFLRLWPAPINPANWPTALSALSDGAMGLWTETATQWNRADARQELYDNLPLTLLLLVFALVLIWRGRHWMEMLTERLQSRASVRGQTVLALLVSLGQMVIPTLGVVALATALQRSGMLGSLGTVVAEQLPAIGFVVFAANWLGGQVFPRNGQADPLLRLTPERRAEGRIHAFSFGLLLGIDALRRVVFDPAMTGDAATAVVTFPILVVAGLLLVRLGQLLRRHVVADTTPGEPVGYRNRLIGLLGQGAVLIGTVGPVLAAVGYVSAAAALVYPAAVSLGLVALLVILQQLISDVYALAMHRDDDTGSREALVPVLAGFVLTLATLPLFALVWGARMADITEMWTRFREGFQLGETRISPTDFLAFAVVFAFGYMLTRLFQGALKASILPKTSLDHGGQNAVVAGVGYIGIFLAGLVAINFAGIDLSGLAIVAGALSLGIGFGLQNIVSNFVSGIILLIERPVSEGDWIEVGGVQGIVKAISVRSTRIQTFDRNDVIVPNADLISGRVTNWTRFNLSGRLTVPVGVAYGSETRKVERVLREIVEAQPLAVLNPPPMVAFMGFGADSMNFEIRVILRDVNFSLSVRSEINHQIARRFEQEGIDMPFAQRDIWLRNPEVLRGVVQVNPAAMPPADESPALPQDRDPSDIPDHVHPSDSEDPRP
ncbi:DUF3772 domain-containing protein [Paracoccaceae bacterium Fryx2]|nr:DUF3772 domain-containing protein [Paracoccaceae bacterium Fryx2]